MSYGIDALELKALSIPEGLKFLLGVEYDIVLCISEVGSRRYFSLKFPFFSAGYQKLLRLCGARFGLTVSALDGADRCCVVSGTPRVPILRYADFIPGQLHVNELLSCFGITNTPKKPKPTASSSRGGASEFEASFIPYVGYDTDAALEEAAGRGYQLIIDYGLCLASHGHLIAVSFSGALDSAITAFQRFCGWSTFDLRFDDDATERSGVIVMPSIQDAVDLFEKYEDEDSDDEDDPLPFKLRPVAPLVPTPFIEDSQLKKLRATHWDEVVKFWSVCPKHMNCLVIQNLYEKATLDEVQKLFSGLTIVESSMVEDQSPYRRRKVFLTFQNDAMAREALAMDGKNTHGKALRIQVSPPYVDGSRRGTVVHSPVTPLTSPQTGAETVSAMELLPEMSLPEPAVPVSRSKMGVETDDKDHSSDPYVPKAVSPALNASAKEFIPRFVRPNAAVNVPPPYVDNSPSNGSFVSPPPPMPSPSFGPPPPYTGKSPAPYPTLSPPTRVCPPPYGGPPPYTQTPPSISAANLPPPPLYMPPPSKALNT